jgi:23S rRNA (pseudouridine1915-N3)-methyltransferase
MKLAVVAVGKLRDRGLADLAGDYSGRIGRFVPFTTHEVRDVRGRPGPEIKRLEGERLLAKLPPGCRAVSLDEHGRDLTSLQVAERLERWSRDGTREVRFVVGGPGGLAASVLDRCDESWRLSAMTLPHEMARVLLLEQLYRGWTILRGLPYHNP